MWILTAALCGKRDYGSSSSSSSGGREWEGGVFDAFGRERENKCVREHPATVRCIHSFTHSPGGQRNGIQKQQQNTCTANQ